MAESLTCGQEEDEDEKNAKEWKALNINDQEQFSSFMRCMLLPFLDCVDPREKLIDILVQTDHLSPVDLQRLDGADIQIPRDRARKVWHHLHDMGVEDFKKDVYPYLCSQYHHIIPREYLDDGGCRTQQTPTEVALELEVQKMAEEKDVHKTETVMRGSKCARCVIKRKIELNCMADLVYHHGCLTIEEYRDVLTAPNEDERMWVKLFDACQTLTSDNASRLARYMCKLLMKSEQDLPENVDKLLARGLFCRPSCKVTFRQTLPPRMEPKTKMRARDLQHRSWAGSHNPLLYKKDSFDRDDYTWADDNDVRSWASKAGLSETIVQILYRHGFKTMEDLTLLETDKVADCFRKESQLPAKEYGLLRKAIESLPGPYIIFDFLRRGDNFRILLVGKTGSGKSATGNTIFGKDLFDTSVELQSLTKDCEHHSAEHNGCTLEIMDSPGLYDTERTNEEIQEVIVRTVCGMYPGPNVILYVIKIGRYTPEEYNTYLKLKEMFDDRITGYMIVLFTHGDVYEKSAKGRVEEMIEQRSPRELEKVLKECQNRYVVFDNNAKKPRPQLQHLVDMMRRMIVENSNQPYTCPRYETIGKEMESEVSRRLEEERTASAQGQSERQDSSAESKQMTNNDSAEPFKIWSHKQSLASTDGLLPMAQEKRENGSPTTQVDDEAPGNETDEKEKTTSIGHVQEIRLRMEKMAKEAQQTNPGKHPRPKSAGEKGKLSSKVEGIKALPAMQGLSRIHTRQHSTGGISSLPEKDKEHRKHMDAKTSSEEAHKIMKKLKGEIANKNSKAAAFFHRLLRTLANLKVKFF